VVIVRTGFAGYNAAGKLSWLAGKTTEIMVINSIDYFSHLPLMPQVAGGLAEPRHVRVSLPGRLRHIRFVLGVVNHIDLGNKTVSGAGGRAGPGRLRPAHPDRGQREQAPAHPGYRHMRAQVPQRRRGHVPARPAHRS
jgi:NADH dehydrogenase FAD-containing subunit